MIVIKAGSTFETRILGPIQWCNRIRFFVVGTESRLPGCQNPCLFTMHILQALAGGFILPAGSGHFRLKFLIWSR